MRAHTSLPLPSKISQIDGLQALRAIAVILVAWLHISQELRLFGAPRLPNPGIFGVDIFFVISGFILSSVVMRQPASHGVKTAWRFFSRRLIRIYPVYWIFALTAILRLLHSHQQVGRSYVPAFFLLPPLQYPNFPSLNTFSWTLIFEMTFYLLLSILLLRTVRLAPYALILVLCISAGGGGGSLADIRRPIWIIFCNPILLEFVLGVVIALVYRWIGTRPRLGILLALAGTGLAFFWQCGDRPAIANGMQMIVRNMGVFARVASFGTAAFLIVGGVVLWSPSMKGSLGRTLVILGNASYSTYLISSIAMEICLRVLLAVHGPNSVPIALLYTLICIAMILGLGWLFYDFIEWPLLRFLQKKLPR